ncbi:MAG: hypothetical protein IAF58_19195 [Leptolyngbya sp.]|nr:hypothetical protein [Candidatus Melainabacteria bacterium]
MSLDKIDVMRFLRSIPSAANHSNFWLVPLGKGVRFSKNADPSGVKVGGIQRLLMLREVLLFADTVDVFAHPDGEASEWCIKAGGVSFSLTLTAESNRGFSGEGQALFDIANAEQLKIASVRALLKWQSSIDATELAQACEMDNRKVLNILGVLGSRGLVGFDLQQNAYFHREMPFDLDSVADMHPRLKNA